MSDAIVKRVKCTHKTLFFSIFLAIACGPSVPAVSAPKDVVAKNLTAPPGTKLVSACTPTGPELCFNAIDDNCNGIIDEGCGVCTGPLQFTIAWGDSAADVNLEVTEPSGTRVDEKNRAASSGLRLDHDCPSERESCNGQNVENICFDGADPPRGHYIVKVVLVDLHGAEAPVLVRWGARVGSRSYGADVELSHAGESQPFPFDL